MITGCTENQVINIDTTKFLPDLGQAEFLKNIINTFNLYFTIDVNNKTINFETYDTLFTNKVNPYDITDKVMSDTLVIEKPENSDASINFKDADNLKVLGDNQYIADDELNALTVPMRVSDENTNKKVFNYIGTSTNKIDVGFGMPTMKRMYIYNEKNYLGTDLNGGYHIMYVPNISKQIPTDNDNKAFNKKETDTSVYNTEDSIQHKGNLSLYYYYGISASELTQRAGVGIESNYFYLNIKNTRQRIGIVSPFIYTNYRTNVNEKLQFPTDDVDSVLASYVQTPYLMLGTEHDSKTDFSLIFNDNDDYGNTLFTKFHRTKYMRYKYSDLLKFEMLMSNVDWQNMQINQPIRINNQIYSLVAINNYDIVSGIAEVVLIKML